ncbi:MAG: TIGR03545 family protein [Treponema sp.]|nr:TIGR03545 family protein [Treponema sp.]
MKNKKKEKLFKSKKLPALFKKTYSEKKFNSKILNKIYIPADKEKIVLLFEKDANPKKPDYLAVPKDKVFTKKDIKFYKSLSKEIKKQKGRIKLLPLIAVVSFISVICVTFVTFKNPITKKVLKNVCESIFDAKTDINSVNLKIFDASLTIQGLYVGNKNNEFENLFEIQKISLDFNLTQALRKKFYAENIEISGMNFYTKRQKSCKLSKKIKSNNENKNSQPINIENPFTSQQLSNSLAELEKSAKTLMNFTDIDSLVNDIFSQLQTASIAEKTYQQISDLITKWQNTNTTLTDNINSFAESIKNLQNLNVNNIKSADDIKQNIERIQIALKEGEKLQNQVTSIINEFQNDTNTINNLLAEFENTVKNDTQFISLQFSKSINNFQNAGEILNSAIEIIGYNFLGEYYPYVKKTVDYAIKYKKTSSSKNEIKKEVNQKNKTKRMEGITFWYSKQNPSLFIKNVAVNGPLFNASIQNISSNQNINDAPTTAKVSFNVKNVNHSGVLCLDVREKTDNPLISIDYTGSNIKIDFDGTEIAKQCGVPSLNGIAVINLNGKADSNGFSASGNVDINPASITSDGFQSKTISEYYQQALAAVNELKIGYNFECFDSNIALGLNGNFTDVFAKTLQKSVSLVEQKVKQDAQKVMESSLDELHKKVSEKNQEYINIEQLIYGQTNKVETLQKNLKAKQIELENQIKKQLKDTTESAIKNIEKNIEKNIPINNLNLFKR